MVHDSCQETRLLRGEGQLVQLRGVGRSSRAFSADKEKVVGGMKRKSLANAMHRGHGLFTRRQQEGHSCRASLQQALHCEVAL